MNTQLDGATLPNQATCIGGKGADGAFHFLLVGNDGSISFSTSIVRSAPTDASSSIATGGTSQQVFAANAARSWLFIQNISSAVMYINFGATAVVDSNSMKLNANSFYENPPHYCPAGTVTIIGATTGQKFVAKQA